MSEPQSDRAWKAPYVPYTTLTNFIEKKMGGGTLPPRIDNGFLDTYAGSVRPILLTALRVMGMVDESGKLLAPMRSAAASEASRRQVMAQWASEFYEDQFRLARENATAQMLWESFAKTGYSGSTLRKAIVFYLALVDDLDLPKSPYFKAPKQASAGSGSSPRKAAAAKPNGKAPAVDDVDQSDDAISGGSGETVVVDLGTAGRVVVSVDVRWLQLEETTFLALRKAVNDMKKLAVAAGPSASASAPDESAQSDERGDQ